MANFLYIKIPWLLSSFLIVICAILIWGIMSSRLILSPPRDKNQTPPDQLGLPYEEVKFNTNDGLELKGWFINNLSAKGTVILCHGFGTNKSDLVSFLPFLHDNGYNIFMFDFRAHGDSPGRCSLGYYEVNDLLGAVDYLKSRQDIDKEKIGAVGVSMGGAVAFMTAAKTPYLKAVVADSSFISFERTVTRFAKLFFNLPKFPLVYLTIKTVELRLGFNAKEADPLKYIGNISPRAVFIIHGEQDARILKENAQLLYKAAKEPKQLWIVPEADHLESHGLMATEYERRIVEFFDKYLSSKN